jgi:hypothetical protein
MFWSSKSSSKFLGVPEDSKLPFSGVGVSHSHFGLTRGATGSVEDEHYFCTLAFMKSKLHIKLTTHLPLFLCMFAQHFYIIQNFLYEECIE